MEAQLADHGALCRQASPIWAEGEAAPPSALPWVPG
jgi:hypothetical protein